MEATQALDSLSVRALSFCPAPVRAGLPSWHPLQLRAKLGMSSGRLFWGRAWVVWERRGGPLNGHPGQWASSCWELGLEGWRTKSLLGSLSEFGLVCSWRGYIRYGRWVTPKGRLEKENSTTWMILWFYCSLILSMLINYHRSTVKSVTAIFSLSLTLYLHGIAHWKNKFSAQTLIFWADCENLWKCLWF